MLHQHSEERVYFRAIVWYESEGTESRWQGSLSFQLSDSSGGVPHHAIWLVVGRGLDAHCCSVGTRELGSACLHSSGTAASIRCQRFSNAPLRRLSVPCHRIVFVRLRQVRWNERSASNTAKMKNIVTASADNCPVGLPEGVGFCVECADFEVRRHLLEYSYCLKLKV